MRRAKFHTPRTSEFQDYRQSGKLLDYAEMAHEVDYELFWHPSFVYGADRRNVQDLELACDGWRISENSNQLTPTTNRLPHWRVGRNLERLATSDDLSEGEYGLAVVVRGDEAHPADIYYFDNLGRIVGYRSTIYHSPNALGKDQKMHPADYVHTGWLLNDADQVERRWQITKWADGTVEMMENCESVRWAHEHPSLIPEAQP